MSVSDNEVTRSDGILIPVGDQTVSAVRYESVEDGPQPALFTYTPYRSDDYATYHAYDPLYRYLAASGYEVVSADVVGTGASSGLKAHPSESADEGETAAAVVEWLAEQEWTTDRVGVFGKSYPGGTAYAVAAENPEPLEAVVTTHADFRTNGVGRTAGGSRGLGFMGGWIPMLATFAVLPPSRRDAEGRWADLWRDRLDGLVEQEVSPATWLLDYVETTEEDEYSRERGIDSSKINAPVLTTTGWRDSVSPQASFDGLEAIDAPTRLHIGPWRHTMPYSSRETQSGFRRKMVEWFDYFLKDRDNGALDGPRIEYWTERNGGGKIEEGVWRGRESWPSVAESDFSAVTFALAPDGLTPADSFDSGEVKTGYEYDQTVGMESLEYKSPPLDTNADDARSLCFESPMLDAPIEFTGTGEVILRATATTADPLFVVRIVDVSPDGTARLVSHGHHQGRGFDSEPTPKDITIQLKPTSHIFEEGHQIRVAISSAYFPRLIPPTEHGSLTLHSTPSQPSLLRFPGKKHEMSVSFENTIDVPPVDTSIETTSRYNITSDGAWETSREHSNDEAVVQTSEEAVFELPHGAVMEWQSEMETSVVADDPSSLSIASTIEAALDYDTERVTVEASSRATHQTAQLTEKVWLDDQLVFENTWRR